MVTEPEVVGDAAAAIMEHVTVVADVGDDDTLHDGGSFDVGLTDD